MKSLMGARLFPEEYFWDLHYKGRCIYTLGRNIYMQIKCCKSNTMEKKSYGGPKNFGPREMTKTVCSDCGKECEVPFKPTEGRPVYCRDCLPKHRKPRF
jgi:CxxC-x17-CxxC domain-containing protein